MVSIQPPTPIRGWVAAFGSCLGQDVFWCVMGRDVFRVVYQPPPKPTRLWGVGGFVFGGVRGRLTFPRPGLTCLV